MRAASFKPSRSTRLLFLDENSGEVRDENSNRPARGGFLCHCHASLYTNDREKRVSYLQVSDGSVERIVAEATFLVQEFSGFPIHGWAEETVIEALLQLLEKRSEAESGSMEKKLCGGSAAARHPRSTIYTTLMQQQGERWNRGGEGIGGGKVGLVSKPDSKLTSKGFPLPLSFESIRDEGSRECSSCFPSPSLSIHPSIYLSIYRSPGRRRGRILAPTPRE